MSSTVPRPPDVLAVPRRHLVVGVGLLLIAACVAFRGWALYGGWFTFDDYVMLAQAGRDLDFAYLLEPFNSHLMPGGRLMTWVVGAAGTLSWGVAATMLLGWQLATAVAALWVLVTLFGARWAVVGLLNIYLWSAMTLPATLWWAAAINQVPLQFCFFVGIGAWVHYLRGRRLRWLLTTAGAVLLGLLFFEKVLLLYGVLIFLAVAYFATGSVKERVFWVARRYWVGLTLGGAMALTFVGYYVTQVPQPFDETDASVAGDTAAAMIGTAFSTAAVGGPWRWNNITASTALADPPEWAVHVSWVVIALVVLYGFLTRERSLRAWALLAGYLAVLWALLVQARAGYVGGDIGLEYRYLTEAAGVLMLCTGLALLELKGAPDSSVRRSAPLLTRDVPRWVPVTAVVVVSIGAVVSSKQFVEIWHETNGSEPYMKNLASGLAGRGAVALADGPVPEDVMSPLNAPLNRVSLLAPLVSDDVTFPESSDSLAVVGLNGNLYSALIQIGVESEEGPREDCGWFVGPRGKEIPLVDPAPAWDLWMRIAYLASAESDVEIRAGSRTFEATLAPGVNDLFLQVDSSFDSVSIEGLEGDERLCVDAIEVGLPVQGRELQ